MAATQPTMMVEYASWLGSGLTRARPSTSPLSSYGGARRSPFPPFSRSGSGGPGNRACRPAHDCSTGVAVCAPSVEASEIASYDAGSVRAGVGARSGAGAVGQDRRGGRGIRRPRPHLAGRVRSARRHGLGGEDRGSSRARGACWCRGDVGPYEAAGHVKARLPYAFAFVEELPGSSIPSPAPTRARTWLRRRRRGPPEKPICWSGPSCAWAKPFQQIALIEHHGPLQGGASAAGAHCSNGSTSVPTTTGVQRHILANDSERTRVARDPPQHEQRLAQPRPGPAACPQLMKVPNNANFDATSDAAATGAPVQRSRVAWPADRGRFADRR